MKKIVKYSIYILTVLSIIVFGVAFINIYNGVIQTEQFKMAFSWQIIIPFILLLFISHLLRMFRIYILLMEKRIKIRKLIPIYLSTTLVNNLLPFKSGEIYKALVYGDQLDDLYKGVIIVWVDRFFDTVIMCLFSFLLISKGYFNNILIVLYLFVLFSILIYWTFYGMYLYFNKLLLISGKTKKSVWYLSGLETARKLYLHAKELIRGRAVILLFLSLIIWMTEYFMIYIVFMGLGNGFSSIEFFNYLNQSFFTINPNNIYSIISILSIFILAIFTFLFSILNIKGVQK